MHVTKTVSDRTVISRATFLAAMLAVLAVGLLLRINSALWRPLDHDEISSANAYTAVGYIDTISQLRAKPAHNIKRLAAGLARTFFIWNQNNHMIHSLALSLGVFLLGADEAKVRAAALAGSLLTALLLMLWAQRRTGRLAISMFCGLAVAVHPYFIYYGQTARGYSFTTLLLLIHVLLVDDAVDGKRGLARLGFSILAACALFLNLTSTLFLWLVPLYACMLLRAAAKPAVETPGGLMARLRGEEFCWWFFQAAAVAGFVVFFGLEHLLMFVKSQADYGVKLASASAALRRLILVAPYLFPGQWLLLAIIGAAGWIAMVRTRYWLAGTISRSCFLIALYVMATKTVPYDRTFGIWILFALMASAWLWKQWLASPRLSSPALAWLPAGAATLLLLAAIVRPHPMQISGFNYELPAKEITRQIRAAAETPRNTFIVIPFLTYEESRLYLPDDPAFFTFSDNSPKSVSVYLPCKPLDATHDGFRCTYYRRNAAEWVYFQLPDAWRSSTTWRTGDFSVVRLTATLSAGESSIAAGTPQIVIWRSANRFFDLDRYVNERLINNSALPEFHFVNGYYFPTPTLIFFLNGDTAAFKKALADLSSLTSGSVLVLTPQPSSQSPAAGKP